MYEEEVAAAAGQEVQGQANQQDITKRSAASERPIVEEPRK